MWTPLSFQRLTWPQGLWLVLLVSAVYCNTSWAQHDHAPAPQPTPQAARKPRIPLGTGAAFAPDGTLWISGLNAQGQLFVQSASVPPLTPAPAADPATAWQWSAPRVLDTGDDVVSASGETRPKLLFGPHATVLVAYTQALKTRHHDGHVRLLRSVDAGANLSPVAPGAVPAGNGAAG